MQFNIIFIIFISGWVMFGELWWKRSWLQHRCRVINKKVEIRTFHKASPLSESCVHRTSQHKFPSCMMIINSCIISPGRWEATLLSRRCTSCMCAAFNVCVCGWLKSSFTCYIAHDITALHTWLRNQVLWIYHAARAERTTVHKVLVNYAYIQYRGSRFSLGWTVLPDLTPFPLYIMVDISEEWNMYSRSMVIWSF